MHQFVGFLRLMRLANIVTAISDIFAGIAIAGYLTHQDYSHVQLRPIILLVISTIGLYGGGVVFNDVFDADLDKVERPERPIPSGLISRRAATLLATLLLSTGIAAAAITHPHNLLSASSLLAIAIALAALIYDKWGKQHSFLGPINMGLCRGLNLLLGISILPEALVPYWFISVVPVIYIAAITMISRGEVYGGKRSTLHGAVVLYGIVIASILYVAFTHHTLVYSLAFLVLFSIMIFPPLQKAIKAPKGLLIRKAVRSGVIALIVMNAAWAAAVGTLYWALLILLLLPLSLGLAKLFSVT